MICNQNGRDRGASWNPNCPISLIFILSGHRRLQIVNGGWFGNRLCDVIFCQVVEELGIDLTPLQATAAFVFYLACCLAR